MYCYLRDLSHPEQLQEYHWKIVERQGGALKYSGYGCGPAVDSGVLMSGRVIAVHFQKYQPVFLESRSVGPDLDHHPLLKLGHRTQLVADYPD